jgi:hypothetical protein
MHIREDKTYKKIDDEGMKNLVGFFEILLKIDQRLNPQDYGLDAIDKDGQKVYTKNTELNKENNG